MTMNKMDVVSLYFQEMEKGRLPTELFAPDFEFYYPKFGTGRGVDELTELFAGLASAGEMRLCFDTLSFIEGDRHVVAECAMQGATKDGVSWKGGETPGGRFCTVFGVDDRGLIERMFAYGDPDCAGADKDRFYWKRAKPLW